MTTCYRCGDPLVPPLDACLSCGAPVLGAGLEAAEWAVELGPIGSQRFRAEAVSRLEAVGLVGLDPHHAATQLARERVRLVEGLERDAAEALAEHLGRRETNAAAVHGGALRRGLSGAVLGGLPLVAVGLGVALWAAWSPVGLVLGVAAAVGLGAFGARRRRPVLALPPPSPLPPAGAEGLVQRLLAAADHLPEADRSNALDLGRRALRLVARLAREDDMTAQIAGGPDGELGRAALATAREVVEVVQQSAESPLSDATRARLAELGAAVANAGAALESVEALGREASAPAAENALREGARALLEQVASASR